MAEKRLLAFSVPATIQAAEDDGNGNKKPATFEVTAYNGGALSIDGFDKPVVIDLQGMTYRRSIKVNLDHDAQKRVGHVESKSIANDGKTLSMDGVFSAATESRREVVESARDGYEWEASIEANAISLEEFEGDSVEVNGQTFIEKGFQDSNHCWIDVRLLEEFRRKGDERDTRIKKGSRITSTRDLFEECG